MFKKILIVFFVLTCGTAHAALKIQSWSLANGARVLFVENHSIPILDVSVEFDAGSRRDPQGKEGVAELTNAMLARGMREEKIPNATQVEPAMTEAQISDALADTAAQQGGGASSDRAGATLRTLSSQKERSASLNILARELAQPSFPLDILTRDKARTISSIKESLTQPEAIASKAFWKALYGPHPYGKIATVESVGAISRDDLVQFHHTYYVANRAVVAMIGDLTRSEAEAIAQELTARLPQGSALPVIPAVQMEKGSEVYIAHPASQAHIMIGMPSVKRGDPDYFSLIVGNYILGGGGFVSRLTNEVREKRGLAYSVYSYFNPMLDKGPFLIGLQTKKAQTDDALKVVHETVSGFLKNGPTEAELKAAKSNLVGGFALRIDNNRKILDNIAVIGYYNLPLDYLDTWTSNVAKVSVHDIRAAFDRKIAWDKMSTIVVGNEK
ncbi:MAG: M16 family metallopeptidase [Burkholderiaceae bacterium]